MPDSLRSVVNNKRILILLFNQMLEDVQYEDRDVWRLLAEGVPLEGDIPKSNVCPSKFRVAVVTPEGLRKLAPTVNQVTLRQVKHSEDQQLDNEMWIKTKEAKLGWISEPVCL